MPFEFENLSYATYRKRAQDAEAGQIDDAVLTGMVLRCRATGFDSYLLRQPDTAPMANGREDLLIRKP
jgi:hypothetical protein